MNIGCIAQANKTARIVWAMLVHGSKFRAELPIVSGRQLSTA